MLPQYAITTLLGRGGMGAVYKGTQKSLDRPVAIKILPPGIDEEDDDSNFSERFKNEARAMAKLSHPEIVSVYDSGETADGLLYIVMESIQGTDVQKMVSEQKRLLWGNVWPPPSGAGNYSDESYHKLRPTDPWLSGYDDGFPTTAPVMSFQPNALGIYDLGGNIGEMTHSEDPAAAAFEEYPPMVQRGASFLHDVKKSLRSANESSSGSTMSAPDKGFRIVLEATP